MSLTRWTNLVIVDVIRVTGLPRYVIFADQEIVKAACGADDRIFTVEYVELEATDLSSIIFTIRFYSAKLQIMKYSLINDSIEVHIADLVLIIFKGWLGKR